MTIEAKSESAEPPLGAIESAFRAIGEVDARMHPTRVDSDLARADWRVPNHVFAVSPLTWKLLLLTQQLHRQSDGLFDPCLPTLPGRFQDIELIEETRVRCHAPVALDLGGIAKGYAVDLAVEELHTAGCCAGLINAGGDIRVFGTEAHEIALRQHNNTIGLLSLCDAALAVSDINACNRPQQHQGYYSRIATHGLIHRFAAIQASSAAVADALTKCALFAEASQLRQLLQSFAATVICVK